jgi:hypothetical protein
VAAAVVVVVVVVVVPAVVVVSHNVPFTLTYRTTAPARPNRNCKPQSRPLVRQDGEPQGASRHWCYIGISKVAMNLA